METVSTRVTPTSSPTASSQLKSMLTNVFVARMDTTCKTMLVFSLPLIRIVKSKYTREVVPYARMDMCWFQDNAWPRSPITPVYPTVPSVQPLFHVVSVSTATSWQEAFAFFLPHPSHTASSMMTLKPVKSVNQGILEITVSPPLWWCPALL